MLVLVVITAYYAWVSRALDGRARIPESPTRGQAS